MVNEDIFPRPGERVLVPWGLEEVLGEVVEVYKTGLGDRAVVRLIDVGGSDTTVTVPADSLTPAIVRTHGLSPRIDQIAFVSEVDAAVMQAARELGLSPVHHEQLDRGIDAVLSFKKRQVAIQMKHFIEGRLSSDNIAALTAYASSVLPVIIIANAGLTQAAEERLRHNNRFRQTTWFVRWTSDADYVRLKDAIREALNLNRA
jgi:hypothetical protein